MLLAVSLACGDTTTPSEAKIRATALTPEETVAALELVAGGNQRARVGRALPQPVVVRLADAGGSPVEGATVTFAPGEGHGTAEPAAVTSDSVGLATTAWTLGGAAGAQTLTASVGGNNGTSIEIRATALTPEETVAALELVAGGNQRARVGRALPQPVVVRLADAGGSPVEGATVTFAPGEGHGTAEPAAVTSDSVGLATTAWTLGGAAGAQTLTASVGGNNGTSIEISATGFLPVPTEVVFDPLSLGPTEAGKRHRDTLVAFVTDSFGDPVVEAKYRWIATDSAAGWVYPARGVTDDLGRVITTSWIAGWPGVGDVRLVVWTASDTLIADLSTRSVLSQNSPGTNYSVWMNTPDRVIADGFSVDLTPLTDPHHTYYAAMQWDGGYTGLQRSGSRYLHQLQFSVWDSPAGDAEVVEKGAGVECRPFGGEGTGYACELEYPWNTGMTYRFEMTEEESRGGSVITLHVTDLEAMQKRFVGALRYAHRADLRSFASWGEDFGRHVHRHCLAWSVRSFAIRRALALIDGSWRALTSAYVARAADDWRNPGTPACLNRATRNHPAGLEVVYGGLTASDPDAGYWVNVPR